LGEQVAVEPPPPGGGGGGGGGLTVTVNEVELEPDPFGVTTEIKPVVAAPGTAVAICVESVTVKDALVPLKVTEVAPVKKVPVSVTAVPIGPLVGEKLVIVGGVGGGGGGGGGGDPPVDPNSYAPASGVPPTGRKPPSASVAGKLEGSPLSIGNVPVNKCKSGLNKSLLTKYGSSELGPKVSVNPQVLPA
jgi:hypothetical protein